MERLVDFNYNSLDLVFRMEIQEQLTTLIEGNKTIQHDVNNIRQGLNNCQIAISRIESYLHNDPATGRDGLVKQVEIHHNVFNEIKSKEVFDRIDQVEDRVDKIEEREKVEKGKKAVWSTVYGFIGGGLLWLAKILLT